MPFREIMTDDPNQLAANAAYDADPPNKPSASASGVFT
jgi:hypothetical protein